MVPRARSGCRCVMAAPAPGAVLLLLVLLCRCSLLVVPPLSPLNDTRVGVWLAASVLIRTAPRSGEEGRLIDQFGGGSRGAPTLSPAPAQPTSADNRPPDASIRIPYIYTQIRRWDGGHRSRLGSSADAEVPAWSLCKAGGGEEEERARIAAVLNGGVGLARRAWACAGVCAAVAAAGQASGGPARPAAQAAARSPPRPLQR